MGLLASLISFISACRASIALVAAAWSAALVTACATAIAETAAMAAAIPIRVKRFIVDPPGSLGKSGSTRGRSLRYGRRKMKRAGNPQRELPARRGGQRAAVLENLGASMGGHG
jgi:hypothetical protein